MTDREARAKAVELAISHAEKLNAYFTNNSLLSDAEEIYSFILKPETAPVKPLPPATT